MWDYSSVGSLTIDSSSRNESHKNEFYSLQTAGRKVSKVVEYKASRWYQII